MPWRETNMLEQRKLFILRMLDGEESFTELCEDFGIPRKTGYKWKARYLERGLEGLADMSRRPKNFREQTPNEVIFEIIRVKQLRPYWGARKIRDYILSNNILPRLPHSRTIDRYLKRCGLVTPQPKSWRCEYSSEEIIEPKEPNDVWTVDHKGWWKTKDGKRCEPLTVLDRYSRAVLNLSAHRRKTFEDTKSRFTVLFEQFGLPLALRMDNGTPFASVHGLHRLTRFSLWLLKLGVVPNRMDPASPYQNGSHERFHRDVKRELQSEPANTLTEEQRRFDLWRDEYNQYRPHEALGGKTPFKVYKKSPRIFNSRVEFEYPPDCELRKISSNGDFWWKMSAVRISKAMAGEHIGLEECGEPDLKVWFYDFCLGSLAKDTKAFTPSKGLLRKQIGRRIYK